MKGTIISKNKPKLSKLEYSILEAVVNMDIINCKTVKTKLQLPDDIPSIRTLSTLYGMDLLLAGESKTIVDDETLTFSKHKREYSCPIDSIQRKRALIVLKYGLDELKKWNGKYGQDLWPFRPTRHFEMKGIIVKSSNGVMIIDLDREKRIELENHINKQINITMDLIV